MSKVEKTPDDEVAAGDSAETTKSDNNKIDFMKNYKSKWQEKFDFSELKENYREETIKQYLQFDKNMNDINDQCFVAYAGGKSLIYVLPKDKKGDLRYLPHNEFLNQYGNTKAIKLVSIKKGEPTAIKVSSAREWKDHPKRRQYNYGVKFYPGKLSEDEQKFYFNTWDGFAIEPKKGEFPKLEYHLRHIWCQDNEEHYNYLIAWFADLVQKPERKNTIALVVKGEKGTGKSIIFELVFEPIFGKTYIKIDKTEQVTGKFNQHLQGKLLLVLEEAIWAGDKSAEGALKSMITDKQIVIERKGIDAEKADSYFRLAFISNEKQAVPATEGERRYFALKTSEEKQRNSQYFKELTEEIENGGREAFLYYIMEYDLSKIDIRNPPQTEALAEDIYAKMDSIWKWSYDLLCRDKLNFFNETSRNYEEQYIWGRVIENIWLFWDYQQWIDTAKRAGSYVPKNDIDTPVRFIQQFNKIFGFHKERIFNEETRITSRALKFPSRNDARAIFKSKINAVIEFPDDDIADSETTPGDEEMEKMVMGAASMKRITRHNKK